MDKRKLMSKSSLLRKKLLSGDELERSDSTGSNEDSTRDVTMQDRTDSSNERISAVLKPLNSQTSSLRSGSCVDVKKKRLYEKDVSERDNVAASCKLSKIEASLFKRPVSQAKSSSSLISQEEDHPSGSNASVNKASRFNSTEKSITRKRKALSPSLVDSDSDPDLSPDERMVVKRRCNEITPNKNTRNVSQDVNSKNSSEKVLSSEYRTPVKPITKFNISQRKSKNKPKEINSSPYTELRKPSAERTTNKRYSPKRPNLCTSSAFSNFLQKCGIELVTDDVHILNVPPFIAKQKMKTLLNSKQYQKKDIIDLIEEYILNEENFVKMLNEMELSSDNRGIDALSRVSLARVLLEVTEIQADVYNMFISKLNESVLLADTPEKVPWATLLLQQFRFLDTLINVDTLTTNIEQLLETCPPWFQQELILFLPDILSDVQHQNIAEVLTKILEENCELTSVILNCIATFNLGKEYLEEYKIKVLHLLKINTKIELIPVIIKFLLNDCTISDIIKQMLLVLRNIEMQPLAGDKVEDCYKNQVQIVKTLKTCMLIEKNVAHTAIALIKDINKNPKPLDLIILLLVFSGTTKQKNTEALLKQNIRSGFYRISLLQTLYNDYKEVVRELQPSILQLASKLLRSEERVFVNFTTEWFRLQFLSQKDMLFKQREIIEKIILFMGNNDQTVKYALAILCQMAENAIERDCLVSHCNHLRILLEKIDCFGLEEVGTLSDLLHSLCLIDDSTSESLQDDLFILLQKQLSAAKPITKCKGVMGAVMAIKHLARKAETCKEAWKLFNKVMKSVKNCPKSQPLFYDKLAQVIVQTEVIDKNFLERICNCIENEFINTYITDEQPGEESDLEPRYGLNNAEDEPQNCMLSFGNKKSGPIAPILFRLLKTCRARLSEHGELESIGVLLGCAILMPQNYDIPESSTLDFVICGINWLREVITGFVTQTDPLLRERVLQRVNTLIHLQGELDMLLMLCDTKYQPPPCYFHYFPLPPFIKIEKKTSKKGKKSKKGNKSNTSVNTSNMEIKSWEAGSTLCSKNPAYFRKFDAKIAHLLDVKISVQSSQQGKQGISIKQVCFLVRELLAIFESEPSESFIKDLIHLLPKVCSKLDDIVNKLRQDNDLGHNFREGARLLLNLLTTIFSWKGFLSITYNMLLREGLRTLARQVNEENSKLRSCKELVAESYKYFESLSDIANEISLATALVNMCQSLMKHSETYTQQYKDKHAKLAYGFLCLEWPEDKHISPQYKLSVIQLLNNWMDNELSPLKAVTSILEWLPDEVSKFENIESTLTRMPSINRNIFQLLYKTLFNGLNRGINVSLLAADSDPKRIKIWHNVASNVQKLVQICKTLKTKANQQLILRYMPQLIKQFVNTGMPVLEHNLKYQTDDITGILKMMQGGTRYLHAICCDSTERKDLILTKYVPVAKSVLEKLIYSVKGMLVLNDSAKAFWMGNLVNKDLEGREIFSQTSSEETTLPDANVISEEFTSSAILDSDLDEDPAEEAENEDTDVDDL